MMASPQLQSSRFARDRLIHSPVALRPDPYGSLEYPWGGNSNCECVLALKADQSSSCRAREFQGPVARYGEATPENNFKAKPDGRYAEVWMGTSHPHGPSSVIKPDGSLQPLKDFILAQPEAVYGKAVNRLTDTAKKEGQIPFLFKTLAAGATLPLQIHPSKQLAYAACCPSFR